MKSARITVDPALGKLPQPKVLRPGQIALTFDDGPHATNTEAILQVLDRFQLKANFFLVGENAESEKDLLEKMVADGHVLGSHSFDHADLTTCDLEQAKGNILNGIEKIHELAGVRSPFFRFPYGKSNPALEALVLEQGLLTFHWDFDSEDWSATDEEALVRKVVDGLAEKIAQKGQILLMHDSLAVTANALASIVEQLGKTAQFVYFDWFASGLNRS